MKNKRKRATRILLMMLILIIITVICSIYGGEEDVSVFVNVPVIGSIIEKIPADGKIRPVTEVKISPDVSGEIVELLVEEGDRVKKGDLIIKIRQDLYLSILERAVASFNVARAQYGQRLSRHRQIESNYLRNKKLFEQGVISEMEFESFIAEYEISSEELKGAEYGVNSAEASIREAEDNLAKTTIYAPINGIISNLNVEVGERVVGTSQVSGTELLRIADLDKMEVVAEVGENDILRVSERDTAYIDIGAYPGRVFYGVVTKIASSAGSRGISSEQIARFEVKIEILPDSYSDLRKRDLSPFKPGMSASVEIITERKEGILTIPLQSVTAREYIGSGIKGKGEMREYVFVYEPSSSSVRAVEVKTGIQDIENIEILSGIASDTIKIVTGPYNVISKTLKDGVQVKI